MKKNPVALIVGAGDFIGAEISRRFAKGGYTVCMGRRKGDKLKPLVDEINTTGRAYPYSLDARDEAQIESIFIEIERDIGEIELVIFNVGANVNFPILETTSRIYRKVWEMACFAGFLTGREAAKYMLKREKGSIFFTGATASIRGGSGFAAFAGAKFGLRALAQSMSRELGPRNIHVAHLVIDAGVETAWVKEIFEKQQGISADDLPPDTLMKPTSIAEVYWMLHHQPRDAWTHELDLRPFAEKW